MMTIMGATIAPMLIESAVYMYIVVSSYNYVIALINIDFNYFA